MLFGFLSRLVGILVIGAISGATAQNPPPPPQDPLITLMSSQPRIDLESPVTAISAFDPPAIRPGEKSIYRVTLNAIEASIEWPALINFPPGLSGTPSAHGQILQTSGGVLVPFTTFNTRLQATTGGTFSIPTFQVKAYGKTVTVPAAILVVSADAPPPPSSPVAFAPGTTNVFVGQSIPVRILLPTTQPGTFQSLGQVEINGKNIFTDQGLVQQRFETRLMGGQPMMVFIHEVNIVPLGPGTISVYADGFLSQQRFSGPVLVTPLIFGNPPMIQATLIESDEILLHVRPLPREGALPGFTGAIGKYVMDPPVLSTNRIVAGQPLKLLVAVHGEGNVARLVPPPPPASTEWQMTAPKPENEAPQIAQARRAALFTYTLVPLNPRVDGTPKIDFSYFDPGTEKYVDLSIPSLPVKVLPASTALPGAPELFAKSPAAEESERPPKLSGLALSPGVAAGSLAPLQTRLWFYLAQLGPAALFCGLILWDRRRRFLEEHPEIVRRNKARRELRAERRRLRSAARAADSGAFTASALRAMRIVCAPHFPAEPRALVCKDILEVLGGPKETDPRHALVARFFRSNDVANYAAQRAENPSLLTEEASVTKLLGELEARL